MIDAHAHVMFEGFNDRPEVFQRAQQAGVVGWLEVGTDIAQSQQAISLAKEHTNVWATVGVHPSDIAELTEEVWQQIEVLLQQPRVVAVGEVGLDYYRGGTLAEQQPVLERFFRLAQEYTKPIVFHVRNGQHDAHEDLLTILRHLPVSDRPYGVIHTFSGTLAQAQAYLELGLYLSFSGVITFKNAGTLPEVVKQTPLDRLLIETDCPFLAPEPYRGQRNEPAYVSLVAQKIAEIKGMTSSEVDQQTEANTRRLFKLG